MFRQQNALSNLKTTICSQCNGKRFLFKGTKITCQNCGHTIKAAAPNKYGAKRTTANDGIARDSKFEANVADSLFARKQLGDIKDYDSQYKVEIDLYRKNGLKALTVSHKVDFRIHHNDGSFELHEAKGVETSDYKFRRRLLEEVWLPDHKDHIYTVIKQRSGK